MPVFKTFFKVVWKNKVSLLVGLLITVAITILYSQQVANDSMQTLKLVIFNQDDSLSAKKFNKYLSDTNKVVKIENTDKAKNDVLFFGKADAVLTIPEDFFAKLDNGEKADVGIQVNPKSFLQVSARSIVNTYLTKYKFYQELYPEKDEEAWSELTINDVKKTAKVSLDSNYQNVNKLSLMSRSFDVLAYGLFTALFSGIGICFLSFNNKDISRRQSCSPLSKRQQSAQLYLATIIYGFLLFILFITTIGIISGNSLAERHFQLLTINTAVFLLSMVAFSCFAASLIKKHHALTALNNIFILGSCFIGGAFVPQVYLPDIVSKIASFTPTYWFVKNNTTIGSGVELTSSVLNEFRTCLGIQLIFAVTFTLLLLVLRKEKSSLRFA